MDVDEDVAAEEAAELRDFVARRVAEASASREELIDDAVAVFEIDDARAATLVDEALGAHAAAERTWGVTDNDRLDRAFAALDRAGIVARQDCMCCRNCGFAEIGGELARRHDGRGVVFYHDQAREAAVERGRLWLCFDAVENDDESRAAIGREIVDALVAAGLAAAMGNEILVTMTWQRRRATDDR